jgi:hypothetical protein
MRISRKLPLLLILTLLGMFALVGSAVAANSFGLERFAFSVTNQNGTPDVQAGSHPYAATNAFVLKPGVESEEFIPPGSLKGAKLEIPPGFVGDPNATPKCAYQTFVKNECSNETAIGITATFITRKKPGTEGYTVFNTHDPLYNLVPPTGVAAEFGFTVVGDTPVFLQTTVRTGTDYGLNVTVPNINQAVAVLAFKVTVWGVPAAPIHDDVRGGCLDKVLTNLEGSPEIETPDAGLSPSEEEQEGTIFPHGSEAYGEIISAGSCPTQTPVVPLLTNPTSCGGTAYGDVQCGFVGRTGCVFVDDSCDA